MIILMLLFFIQLIKYYKIIELKNKQIFEKGNEIKKIKNQMVENEKEIKETKEQIKEIKEQIKEIKEQIKEKITYKWEEEKLVVHALGRYNNTIYTNSLEALKYWYGKNMRLMEADFHLTQDNHTVTAHDFSHLSKTPTLEEFKKSYAKGYLTPMTFEDLVIFMEQHPDLYIITDTKFTDKERIQIEFDEMTEILSRHKSVNERFIIEIYNEQMFLFLKEKKYPFKFFMFTLYQRWDERNYDELEKIFAFCAEHNINAIILFEGLFNSRINELSKKYAIPIYLHTVNSLVKITNFLKDVKGVFTDDVTKAMLNEYISNINKTLL